MRLDIAPAHLWAATAWAFVVLFALNLVLSRLDQRQLGGESVWSKPLKFEASLALHFATLSLITGQLTPAYAGGVGLVAIAFASIAAAVFEIGYIAVQAGRGRASHFNLSTPVHNALYALMGPGAVVIVAAAIAVGIAALVDSDAQMSAPLRLSVVLGLLGGSALTLIVALTMGGRLDRHVGRERAGAMRVPLAGWSFTVGDLRAPHFLATHMMQVLPAIGLAAGVVTSREFSSVAVWCAAAGWTALTWLEYRRALAGRPTAMWPSAGKSGG